MTGIDIDSKAISIAKENARFNKIENIDFSVGDLRKWNLIGTRDVIAANLYSELFINVLPTLKRCTWLILSGVLRSQENEFLRVLRWNNIKVVNVKRRGKWIAVLAIAAIIDDTYRAHKKQKFALTNAASYFLPALAASGSLHFTRFNHELREKLRPCRTNNLPMLPSRHTRCANRAPAALLDG